MVKLESNFHLFPDQTYMDCNKFFTGFYSILIRVTFSIDHLQKVMPAKYETFGIVFFLDHEKNISGFPISY